MKKIGIHTGNVSYGGQEKMVIEFLKTLDKSKYEVYLFIEENKGIKNIYEKEIPKWINYEYMTDLKFMEKIENYRGSKNIFKKIIRSIMLKRKKKISMDKINERIENIDLLIDYDMGLMRNLHRLNKGNKRLIGWSHAGNGGIQKKKFARKNILFYDEIVSINGVMEEGFKKNYGTKGIKIHKIYNFVDDEKIIKMSMEPIEENLGRYILNVGSLTKNKNQKIIIEAFKKYLNKTNDQNLNLVIIGEGKEDINLRKQVKDSKLENRVYFLGNKENPYKYMKNCEVYIQSSLAEGFPLVLIEALTLDRPILSSNTNGGLEILNNGKYGMIFKDSKDLEIRLERLLSDKKLLKEYEKLSSQRKNIFSKNMIGKEIEKLIEGEN